MQLRFPDISLRVPLSVAPVSVAQKKSWTVFRGCCDRLWKTTLDCRSSRSGRDRRSAWTDEIGWTDACGDESSLISGSAQPATSTTGALSGAYIKLRRPPIFPTPALSIIMPTSGNTYFITNKQSGTALDLSGDDQRSIIGFDLHRGDNQKARDPQ
jgi:hypothetical protein